MIKDIRRRPHTSTPSSFPIPASPLMALLNGDEKYHARCVETFKALQGKWLSSDAVLTEALYLLNNSFKAQKNCFEFIQRIVDIVPSSKPFYRRCCELMDKYKNVPMDFADATLVVLAEEIETDIIFTLNRRGFETYRWKRTKPFKIIPDLHLH